MGFCAALKALVGGDSSEAAEIVTLTPAMDTDAPAPAWCLGCGAPETARIDASPFGPRRRWMCRCCGTEPRAVGDA